MDKLIIGLGNPGKKYEDTRHNVGFQAVNRLADEWSAPSFTASSHTDAFTTKVVTDGQTVLLVKPQTFMNKSGEAVKVLADYFDIAPKNILTIHDDVDLPFGSLRMSFDSSAGGHNGVRSVINELGTQAFARLRIGIAPTDKDGKVTKPDHGTRSFVLGQWGDEEAAEAEMVLGEVAEATEAWLVNGTEAVMNEVN